MPPLQTLQVKTAPPSVHSSNWAPSPSPPPSPDIRIRKTSVDSSTVSRPRKERSLSDSSSTSTNKTKTPKAERRRPNSQGNSLRMLQKAYEWHTRKQGNTAEAAAYLNRIGNFHFREGKFDKAVSVYRQAVGLTDDSTQLAAAYANLGTVYWTTGCMDQAVIVLNQALKTYELEAIQGGGLSLENAGVHHQLGLCYALQGKFAAAVQSMHAACRIRERMTGAESVPTARTVDALGKVYRMCGDWSRALECHERAFKCLQAHGAACTTTLENMLAVHMARGNDATSIHILLDILREKKAAFTKSQSPICAKAVSDTLQTMAVLYQRTYKYEEAALCHKEVGRVYQLAGLAGAP